MDDWADVSLTTLSSRLFACDPSWDLPSRTKSHYQLWVVTSGSMDFSIGSADFVAGRRSVILIPPRVEQRAVHRRGPLETYVVHFMAYDRGVPRTRLWGPRLLSAIPTRAWERITDDIAELTAAAAGSRRVDRLIATATLTDAIARCEGLPPSHLRELGVGDRYPAGVAAAMAHIRRHPDHDLSTRALADQVHLSPEALRVSFKRSIGQSPGEFVRQHRIGLAKTMLLETDRPVSAVARAVGIPDAFYFSRLFTTVEGIPPSQFRRSATEIGWPHPSALRRRTP